MQLVVFIALFGFATAANYGRRMMQEAHSDLNTELDNAQLTKKTRLHVSTHSANKTVVVAGTTLTLFCEAAGTPVPVFYWTHNGKRVQSSLENNLVEKIYNTGHRTLQTSITHSDLVIPCADARQAGEYKCIAVNGHQRVEKTMVVTVESSVERENACDIVEENAAPKIIQYTESRFEAQGNSVLLMCRTNKPAQIVWYNEAHDLLNGSDRVEIMANGDLLIKTVTWEDMGVYTCVASNEHGENRVSPFLYPTSDFN